MRPGCSRSVYLTRKLSIHAGIFLYAAPVTAAAAAVAVAVATVVVEGIQCKYAKGAKLICTLPTRHVRATMFHEY